MQERAARKSPGELSFSRLFLRIIFLRKKGATIFLKIKKAARNNQAEPDEVVPAEGFAEIQGGKEGENRQGNDFLNGLEFRRAENSRSPRGWREPATDIRKTLCPN